MTREEALSRLNDLEKRLEDWGEKKLRTQLEAKVNSEWREAIRFVINIARDTKDVA